MSFSITLLVGVTSVLLAPLFCAAVTPGNAYLQHNLVADVAGVADFTDPNLVNAWGIATSATSPFWVNDGGTGLSTVYTSSGSVSATKAIIPPTSMGTSPSVATGIVWNGTGGFLIQSKAPSFIFATQDGGISAWASSVDATHALLQVDNSASGAVYDGLAISNTTATASPLLYAANFHSGSIDVFDTSYKPAPVSGGFADSSVPAGFAPFNIQNLGGKLYVTYAKQDANKHFDVAGVGNGYVAVFDLSGTLIKHLVSGGPLNSPWGVAIASANFGAFSGALLVGNFGDGLINAFDPGSGAFLGTLQDASGNNIRIDGLWGLIIGNGGNGGDANALYFAAGPGGQQHGLFGSLQAAPVVTSSAIGNAADVQTGGIAQNTYVAIYGANLAATTRTWQAKDFVGNKLPTSLDGVSVMVNGKAAYVYYISPKQIDILTPADSTTGAVPVQITNSTLTSGSVSATLQPFSPAFFVLKDGKSIAAEHGDYTVVGATTLYAGQSTPAKPGEEIVLFGNGFGPTNPAAPDGQIVSTPLNCVNMPSISFNNVAATVIFAGLSATGLYQFNVVVPPGTADGDIPVTAQVGGVSTTAGTIITVQH